MAVYVCTSGTCRFMFERVGEISKCPDCGKPGIRNATEEEVKEFRNNQSEAANAG